MFRRLFVFVALTASAPAPAQISLPVLWQNATVYPSAVAWSPNGKLIAIAGYSTSMVQILTASGEPVTVLSAYANANSIQFSSDGTMLAVGTGIPTGIVGYGAVQLWSASTWNLKSTFISSARAVQSVAFSADGKRIADGGETDTKGVVEEWNIATGKVVASFPTEAIFVNSVALSPDGKFLALGGATLTFGVLELWNTSTQLLSKRFATATTAVDSVAVSPDGKTLGDGGYHGLASDSPVGVLELWSLPSYQRVASLKTAASRWVAAVAFSSDGKSLASGGESNSGVPALEIWNAVTLSRTALLASEISGGVLAMAISSDAKTLAAVGGGESGALELWSTVSHALTFSTDTLASNPTAPSIAYSPDGSLLAAGGQLYDGPTGIAGRRLWDSVDSSSAFTPDGTSLVTGGLNNSGGTLEIWNLATSKRSYSFKTGATHGVTALAVSANGKVLVDGGISGSTGLIEVWDLSTKARVLSESIPIPVQTVALSPDGKTMAIGGRAESDPVGLLDVATGGLTPLNSAAVYGTTLAFSPDGQTLAVGGSGESGGVLELWNVSRRSLEASLPTQSRAVDAVCFSANGALLVDGGVTGASAPVDLGALECWQLANGQRLVGLSPLLPVIGLAVSSDGKHFAVLGSGQAPVSESPASVVSVVEDPAYGYVPVSAVVVTPGSVVGGGSVTGKVTLTSAAPTGGSLVTLTSSSADAVVPTSVLVPGGAKSATFSISTKSVGVATKVTISAIADGKTQIATLKLNPK